MSATFSLAKHIMGEKPHSSITDWVEVLSSDRYRENELDGIPELVDSINLQAEGPTEASRAIRKKLKYGNVHRQLRALTILKALVENCGPKFQATFANDLLVDRIKTMANDSLTDEGVKRKLMAVLKSWHVQFKDDPKMTLVAGLWASCGGGTRLRPAPPPPTQAHNDYEEQARIRAEQKAKERAAKEEEKRKEKERKEKERRKPTTGRTQTRKPFDFEKEKPQILTAVANASQASIQLGNALKLVNREKESIQENAHVQESLANAKAARKAIVRYVQLVENEELIGTLIDANERIITSLQLYDRLLKSADNDSEDEENAAKLASLSLSAKEPPVGEISKLQGKQRAEIQRSVSRSSLNVNSRGISRPPMAGGADAPDLVRAGGSSVHPDLKDLNWGSLGEEAEALPPPIRPVGAGEVEKDRYGQGSLSDYSDYDSSEDDRPSTAPTSHGAGPSSHRAYEEFVDKNEKDDNRESLLDDDDDPFADPFADSASIVSNDVVATDKKPDWR